MVGKVEGNARVFVGEVTVGGGHRVTTTDRGAIVIDIEELPSHFEVGEEERIVFTEEGENEHFADAIDMGNCLAAERVFDRTIMRHCFTMKDLDSVDHFTNYFMLELDPDGLHFGEFRHRWNNYTTATDFCS